MLSQPITSRSNPNLKAVRLGNDYYVFYFNNESVGEFRKSADPKFKWNVSFDGMPLIGLKGRYDMAIHKAMDIYLQAVTNGSSDRKVRV